MAAALGEEAPDNEDYYGLLNVRREVRPRGPAGPRGEGGARRGTAGRGETLVPAAAGAAPLRRVLRTARAGLLLLLPAAGRESSGRAAGLSVECGG